MFQSIGKKYPEPDEFIRFNDTISYTLDNVKYPQKNIQEIHAKESEAAAQTQTEHCKDKGSWAAMIENRKNAVSEKESNAAAQEQKPDIHKGNFGR